MANKYSRYELQPFPSLYVDNKQPEIAALLADRYDKNKTSKDLIDRTLSQLELLDGDKSHLERVKLDVKNTLKDHIDEGDWENSSLVVADAAMLVETDAGLIAANKSMKNRQAEIAAVREARLNGIPMIDFGANSRKTHQSYYYDEEADSYTTNVYEPMSQKQLDYRTRKEKMIGNIPASQIGNWAGVTTLKANKTANQVITQYIEDTAEGQQEFRKLVELELPQSLPLEERQRMAKNEILKDFKEVAQQQVYDKSTATGENNGTGDGTGITITSSQDTPIHTGFDNLSDKINGIQEENLALLNHLDNTELDPALREEYERQLATNNKLLYNSLERVSKDSPEGQAAFEDYKTLTEKFEAYGPDGVKLLAATQYLTLNTYKPDTDWKELAASTATGAGAGATWGWFGGPWGAGAMAIGGGAVGFFGDLIAQTRSLNNVRDLSRVQNKSDSSGPTLGIPFMDDEREQLYDELYGGENVESKFEQGKATIDHLNKTIGTDFKESDLKELMDLTNSYYTFMVDDKTKDVNGVEIRRSSGDDLMKAVNASQFTTNQKMLSFDSTADGKKKRNNVNSFVGQELNLNNPGVRFDGMNPKKLNKWLDDMGGAQNLAINGILLPNIPANTPLRINFSSNKDASGKSNRTATVTDPTVLQPGGWVYDLLYDNYGKADAAYNELIRQDYDRAGYANKTLDDYTLDLAEKQRYFRGGDNEQRLIYKRMYEDNTLKMMLADQENFTFAEGLYTNPANGIRAIKNDNGQYIPFRLNDGSFNEAAWTILSNRPTELAGLRKTMLETTMQDFSNIGI